MAKGRDRPHRETKKPKASKKPAAPASSFLRPQPAPPATKQKATTKPE